MVECEKQKYNIKQEIKEYESKVRNISYPGKDLLGPVLQPKKRKMSTRLCVSSLLYRSGKSSSVKLSELDWVHEFNFSLAGNNNLLTSLLDWLSLDINECSLGLGFSLLLIV